MNHDLLEVLRSDVLEGAQMLLGSHLVAGELRARIVEVEAYRTPDDPGCHAHRGQTPRNAVLFDRAGLAYVYFCYGVHWMLNVVAHEPGNAAAVLIRAAEPLTGLELMKDRRGISRPKDLLAGPGRLAQAFGLSGKFTGVDLFDEDSPIQIEAQMPILNIAIGTRIGLAPGKGAELPWRFLDGDSKEYWSRPV